MSAERSPGRDAAAALRQAAPAQRETVLRSMQPEEVAWLRQDWPTWRRDAQAAPAGDWRVWVMMAGRGFGKTRAGAEWVLECVREPGTMLGAAGPLSAALVAATPEEARRVMVEGRSGLLATARAGEIVRWEASLGRLKFGNGGEAQIFSGANPDGLRGPEHHLAWCDELAKWARPDATWTNLMLGLRLGERPRALVTTTPRAIELMKRLTEDAETVLTRGRTRDNPFVAESFVQAVEREHAGTRLGRQELDGELLLEVEGSLFPRDWFEARRMAPLPARAARESALSPEGRGLMRVVVGVDPPASSGGDACGIVAVGLDADGVALVLEDASVEGASPEGWARAVAACAGRWRADRVVAEANQGGDMVRSVLRAGGLPFPVTLVHATRGKAVRAEPVALHYEAGRVRHAGRFPALEDQLNGLTRRGYAGPGRSPDRADALIWAATELLVRPARREPRVLRF